MTRKVFCIAILACAICCSAAFAQSPRSEANGADVVRPVAQFPHCDLHERLWRTGPLPRRERASETAGARRKARRILWRLHHRHLAPAGIFSREALCQSWNRRPDDFTNAGAFPPGRHRPATEGSRHSRRNERHRRQHRPHPQRGYRGQLRLARGIGEGQRNRSGVFLRASGPQLHAAIAGFLRPAPAGAHRSN